MSKVKPCPLPPGSLIGGYQVLRQLAVGGFGVVYLASDPAGRPVAIKEYLPAALTTRKPGELAPRVVPQKASLYLLGLKSFLEEGRSLARISHPSVVEVKNFFRANDTVYMVMNYLQGASLQEFVLTARQIKHPGVLQEASIRSLFGEILHGLRVVHQHQMLHLDIKPANIFITDSNQAVMIDFGAVREMMGQELDFDRPTYTPGFAAPEMYRRDSNMGPWTDLYAIGACMFACMQGRAPTPAPQRYPNDPLAAALKRLQGLYSADLISIVQWCLTLQPPERPQSVQELQQALTHLGAPHQSRPGTSLAARRPRRGLLDVLKRRASRTV